MTPIWICGGRSENNPDQVGGVDNGGRLAGVLTVPGTDRHEDYVHAVQKLPDTDHVSNHILIYFGAHTSAREGVLMSCVTVVVYSWTLVSLPCGDGTRLVFANQEEFACTTRDARFWGTINAIIGTAPVATDPTAARVLF